MSKKVDDSELQTLTLSPTNTNDDESSPFINPASDETAFPISPPPSYSSVTTSSSTLTGEKRKLERMASAPSGSCSKPVPALRVSTPPGSSRITYTNERANERKMDLSKIIRERPTPSASIGQKKAAQHPPDTPRYKDCSASPGMKGLVVNAPNSKATSLPWVRSPPPPPPLETQVRQKASTSGTDVTPSGDHFIFASSTPVSPVPLLPMPPSRGTPSTVRSEASRAWLNRSGMRSGLRYRTGMDARKMDRPVQHHTFLADVADVRQIEQGLLQLMEDFQAGSLRAFGKDSRLRQMEAIREQQERLARLHFDVGAEQDLYPPLSEEGLRASHSNMHTLMEKLAQLSESIERLHTNTSSSERKSAPSHLFAQWSSTDSPPKAHHHHHHHHHGHHHHSHHHGHHHHHHHHSSHNTSNNNTTSTLTESLSSSQQTTPTNTHNANSNTPAPATSATHHHNSSPGSSRLSQGQPPVPLRLKGTNGSPFSGTSKTGKVGDS